MFQYTTGFLCGNHCWHTCPECLFFRLSPFVWLNVFLLELNYHPWEGLRVCVFVRGTRGLSFVSQCDTTLAEAIIIRALICMLMGISSSFFFFVLRQISIWGLMLSKIVCAERVRDGTHLARVCGLNYLMPRRPIWPNVVNHQINLFNWHCLIW